VDVRDGPALEEIDVATCYELLGRCTVGRVAVNVPGLGPLVVPVNFVLDGDAVVFRTDAGTKLRLLRDGPISFQVDSIDHSWHTGWSVLVRGVAYEADGWEVQHLRLDPWAGGGKQHWVRLLPALVTGRRIARAEVAVDARGYW
jgi:nitroimidazol reductase NimA-like FMN-containing flavoprotein (pyridoxamine 5'-phosphate oxidase superfamily)